MNKLLDRLARDIAKQIHQDSPPLLNQSLSTYLDAPPQQLMTLLDNLIEHLESGLPPTDALIGAYLFLLASQLEEVRYKVDRHYDWAQRLVADFQARLVQLARNGRLPPQSLQQLILVLHEVRLQPEPALLQAAEELLTGEETGMEPPSPDNLLALLQEQLGESDEFQAAQLFTELTFGGPGEGRAMLARMMLEGPYERLREAVPLLVLDPDPEMRKALVQGLSEADGIGHLSPTGLRRLIALRNWLPEEEREALDRVIRTARRQGLDCQPWPAETQAEIQASPVDGSGAQGFLLVSRAGRRFRFSSLLLRLTSGVLEAWIDPRPQTKKELNQTLAMAGQQVDIGFVSQAYLERAVQHHLAVGVEREELPPAGLLAIAEVLGTAHWQPNRLDPMRTVEDLLAGVPESRRETAAVRRCLKDSDRWALESGIVDSWFEDDQAVAELLGTSRARRQDTLVRQVLERIIEPRRERWAEKMLWAALWLREIDEGEEERAVNFLLVAQALFQGQPLKTIPLMKAIAGLTVQTQQGF